MFSTIDEQILVGLYAIMQLGPSWTSLAVFMSNYLIIIVLLGAVIVLLSGNKNSLSIKGERVIAQAGLAVVVATFVGFILAALVARERPYQEMYSLIQAPSRALGNSSFPSAHAWISFAVAGVISFHSEHANLGKVIMLGALLVAVGRVMMGYHFPSDVIAGALLGLVSAYGVVFYSKRPLVWLARMRNR